MQIGVYYKGQGLHLGPQGCLAIFFCPLPTSFPTPLTECSRIPPLRSNFCLILSSLTFSITNTFYITEKKWMASVWNSFDFIFSPTPVNLCPSVTSSPFTSFWKVPSPPARSIPSLSLARLQGGVSLHQLSPISSPIFNLSLSPDTPCLA